MEDGGISYEKLLVARSNERCGKVCGRVQSMPEDENRIEKPAGKLKLSEVP